MTHQQILEKAFKKAMVNGYFVGYGANTDERELARHCKFLVETGTWRQIIFDHKLAKSIWGEPKAHKDEHGVTSYNYHSGWQYHLKQMVIAPDPIGYLGDNL